MGGVNLTKQISYASFLRRDVWMSGRASLMLPWQYLGIFKFAF